MLGVAMCLRVAEKGQNAVAHVFGDKTVEPADRLGNALVVRTDHLPEVLRIEPRSEGCGAHEIAEHYSELATLGRGNRDVDGILCRDLSSSLAGRSGLVSKGSYGIKEFSAMPYRTYPKCGQVFRGQPWQHVGVDVVIAERRRVLFKP